MGSDGDGARRSRGLAFLLFLAALVVLRAALAGWPALSSAGVAAVFGLYVLLPGWAIARLLRPDEEHALASWMLAWAIGQALLAGAFLATCVLDARSLIRFYPLPFVLLAAVRIRKRSGPTLPPPSLPDLVACGALLVLAALRSYCEGPGDWYLGGSDALFHAGNAAELRWRWPMQDPRLAGEPLRYHFFSYSFACVQSLVLGSAVRPGLFGTGATLHTMGFALAAFATARALGARTWIAAACGGALVLHTDLGGILHDLFGAPLEANSLFDKGLYTGCTTPLGLTFLLALLHVACGGLRPGAPQRGRDLVLAGILAFGASGSKGSVLPPLLLGLAGALALRFAFRRELSRSALLLLAVLVVGALPMTWFLVRGESSYAASMFAFEPFAAQRASPFHATVSAWLGTAPGRPSAAMLLGLAPPWTALFLGAGTIGLCAWLGRGERPRPLHEIVLLTTAIAGLLPAWLLAASGLSQLFFAYDSQVCAALLGAVGLERAVRARGPVKVVLIAALALLLALQARRVARWPAGRIFRAPAEGSESSRGYQEALFWVRDHLERDAVLLVGPTWISPSTWTERRSFFESASFSPRVHAGWTVPWRSTGEPEPSPFAAREELEARFLAEPDPASLAAVRALVPEGTPLYALRDHVRLEQAGWRYVAEFDALEAGAPWGRSVGAELVHATPWLEVYRLP